MIFLRPQFLPGTTEPITADDLAEMIKARQAILRKHRQHEAVKAVAEFLEAQAVRANAAAVDVLGMESREHLAGQAYALNYVTGLLRTIIDQPEQPQDEDDDE